MQVATVQHRSRLPLQVAQQVALAITALVQDVVVGLPVVLGNFTASSIVSALPVTAYDWGVKSVFDVIGDGWVDVLASRHSYGNINHCSGDTGQACKTPQQLGPIPTYTSQAIT